MYKITTEVTAQERDLIIAGIKSATEIASEQLVHAAQAGLRDETVCNRAKLVTQLAQIKHSFGWNHDYKSAEEGDQI